LWKLGLCHTTDPTCLSSNSLRLCTYRQATSPQKRVRKPQITTKALIDTRQVTSEASTTRIKPKEHLESHTHFSEHLSRVIKKPPQECNKNPKSSSICLRRLKNNTGGHLQESSPRQEIDTTSQAFRQTHDDHKQSCSENKQISGNDSTDQSRGTVAG
jgi:hypothetical protein